MEAHTNPSPVGSRWGKPAGVCTQQVCAHKREWKAQELFGLEGGMTDCKPSGCAGTDKIASVDNKRNRECWQTATQETVLVKVLFMY